MKQELRRKQVYSESVVRHGHFYRAGQPVEAWEVRVVNPVPPARVRLQLVVDGRVKQEGGPHLVRAFLHAEGGS